MPYSPAYSLAPLPTELASFTQPATRPRCMTSHLLATLLLSEVTQLSVVSEPP